MLDVYNTVLQLARERRSDYNFAATDQIPVSMPEPAEVLDALDRMNRNRYVIPDVTADPILKRSLMRIGAINRMVLEHAEVGRGSEFAMATSTATAIRMPTAKSGEMRCPECERGTLCYLIGKDGEPFVECSTVGCLYWDSRS